MNRNFDLALDDEQGHAAIGQTNGATVTGPEREDSSGAPSSTISQAAVGTPAELAVQCSYCRRFKGPQGTWAVGTEAHSWIKRVSHGICPPCDDAVRVQYGLPPRKEAA